jgi:hypothetical protein
MPVLTFASAAHLGKPLPLRKRFERRKDGSVTVSHYPHAQLFSTRNVLVEDLGEFAHAIEDAAKRGEVLFKGTLTRELKNESRAGVLSNDASTDWVCLDFDKLPGLTSPEDLLKGIDELSNVSYIVQYASSHGLDGRFSAHVFMLLEQSISSRMLEAWLTNLNLSEATLARHVRLNAAGLSISWPLDPVPARNTQIIYIATPEFVGMPDPMKGERRIRVVKHRHDRLTIAEQPKLDEIIKQRRKKLRELRAEAGMGPVQWKPSKGHMVISGASAVVSEIVDSNDRYVRVNLNGGDSAAYWFWRNDPTYLFSFKDETEIYKLEELDPEFYKKYTNSSEYKTLTDRQLVAFMEQGTGSGYRIGEFDQSENEFYVNDELVPEPWLVSKDKYTEFLKFQGYKPAGFITPPGFVTFDPKDIGPRFDPTRNRVNKFKSSRYMLAKPLAGKVPPTIAKLLSSVLGSDPVVEHFLKWFAYLFAERTHVGTSWLLQGKQGTGKSILVHNVLCPLVGESNFALITPSDLADRFNDYIAERLLVFIDEADLNKVGLGSNLLNSRIKSIVGNKRAAVRKMYKAVAKIENFSNLLLATNTMNAVAIAMDDRRFNVGDYQLKSLIDQRVETGKFVKALQNELDAFSSYLLWLAPRVDPDEVSRPMETDAKAQIQEHTLPSTEHVTRLIEQGSLDVLFGYLSKEVQPGNYDLSAQYEKVLMRWLHSPQPFATREEVLAIFRFHVPKFMRDYVGPISEGRFLVGQGFRSFVRKLDGVAQRVYVVEMKASEELKRTFPREGGSTNLRRVK